MIWSKNATSVVREQYDLSKDPHEENNLHGTSKALPEDKFLTAANAARNFFADPHPFPGA
jgi:hypothetical protein